MTQFEPIDIDQIIGDNSLKPYVLEYVASNFKRQLFESHHNGFNGKVHAIRDFYDSLCCLTEQLEDKVPDARLDETIGEVVAHYMGSVSNLFFETDDSES